MPDERLPPAYRPLTVQPAHSTIGRPCRTERPIAPHAAPKRGGARGSLPAASCRASRREADGRARATIERRRIPERIFPPAPPLPGPTRPARGLRPVAGRCARSRERLFLLRKQPAGLARAGPRRVRRASSHRSLRDRASRPARHVRAVRRASSPPAGSAGSGRRCSAVAAGSARIRHRHRLHPVLVLVAGARRPTRSVSRPP